MNITPMDHVRAALYNAAASGLTFADLVEAAVHANTPEDFDRAINLIGLATEEPADAQVQGPQGRQERLTDGNAQLDNHGQRRQ